MSPSSRYAILALAGVAAAAAVALAAARPPTPARLAGYGRVMTWLGRWAHFVSGPPLALLAALRAGPDAVTVLGLALSAGAGVAAGAGELGWAGVLLVLAAWCDLLDGELARRTGAGTPAGAFLDSSLDRVAEMAVFTGLAAAFPDRSGVLWAVSALSASLMVSYARARGEGLGVACPTFGLERPHRLLALMLALLAAPFLPPAAALAAAEGTCAFIAVGAGATALARIVVIRRILLDRAREAPAKPEARAATGAAAGGPAA